MSDSSIAGESGPEGGIAGESGPEGGPVGRAVRQAASVATPFLIVASTSG